MRETSSIVTSVPWLSVSVTGREGVGSSATGRMPTSAGSAVEGPS